MIRRSSKNLLVGRPISSTTLARTSPENSSLDCDRSLALQFSGAEYDARLQSRLTTPFLSKAASSRGLNRRTCIFTRLNIPEFGPRSTVVVTPTTLTHSLGRAQ
ncbi:hypothetical protein M3Y94_00823500 [Aphelenchoides besseyi]|nr:hypothetical protein M3Y94_00823500 [Aphelenchoides besseyi]